MGLLFHSEKVRSELYKMTGGCLCTPLCAMVLQGFLTDADIVLSIKLLIKIVIALPLFILGQLVLDQSVRIMYSIDEELAKHGS